MELLKKYKFGVDVWAIVLFMAVMLPNFIWFGVPAPGDILRGESITPGLDFVASVCQVLFIALLALLRRNDAPKTRLNFNTACVIVWYAVYLFAWLLYYKGSVSAAVIILLCLTPCLAFGSYAADRQNVPALILLAGFTICHLLYGVINFIL